MRFDIKLGVLCRTDFGQYLGVLITRKLYFIITKTKKSGGHLDVTTWPYYGHPTPGIATAFKTMIISRIDALTQISLWNRKLILVVMTARQSYDIDLALWKL